VTILLIGLSGLLFFWAGTAMGFSTVALSWVRHLIARTDRVDGEPVAEWPPIVILRPCEGGDAELEANLLSSVTARYDGPRRVIVLVPSATDPAYDVAVRVRDEAARLAPSVPFEVRLTAIQTHANRKVAQLAAVEREIAEPILVTADSDIRFDHRTLPSLLRALASDPKAGAATAPQVEVAPRTLGDWASAALLSSTPHAFLCLAGLAEQARGAHNLCGALVAYRRGPLKELGGFHSLETFLGEDFEFARRLHERGYTIATAAVAGPNYDSGRTLAQVTRRYARWSVVTRQQRPSLYGTYFLFLGCTPLLFVLTAVVAATRPPYWYVSVLMAAIFLATRLALGATLRGRMGLPRGPLSTLAAVVGGELLILAGALGAIGEPEVEWRGYRYRVGAGGRMERLAAGEGA
jgi:cellulose synthase/poly-beta-1,6-N-acetylglucosamine synthase-like glycosyltransferase